MRYIKKVAADFVRRPAELNARLKKAYGVDLNATAQDRKQAGAVA